MNHVICPISNKLMDCKTCAVPKGTSCIYWKWDKLVEQTIRTLREAVERENSQG